MWYQIMMVTVFVHSCVSGDGPTLLNDNEKRMLKVIINKLNAIHETQATNDYLIANVKRAAKELNEEFYASNIASVPEDRQYLLARLGRKVLKAAMGLARGLTDDIPRRVSAAAWAKAKTMLAAAKVDGNKLNKEVSAYMKRSLGSHLTAEESELMDTVVGLMQW